MKRWSRGFNLWDRDELPHYATQRNARRLSELGGVAFLAQLLATPRADGQKPIVALVRGRQVGPWAVRLSGGESGRGKW